MPQWHTEIVRYLYTSPPVLLPHRLVYRNPMHLQRLDNHCL